MLWLHLHNLNSVAADYPIDSFALADQRTFNTFVMGMIGYYLDDFQFGL